MNTKQAIIFFGGVFFLIIFIEIIIISNQRGTSNEYFRDLNLVLTGIVTNKQMVTAHGAGMLYVDIRNTSISEYDVRGRVSNYYCVIHNGKAELLENSLHDIHTGDSLSINSQINSFECYRNNKLVFKKWLNMGFPEPVKSMIERLHRL